jgi:tetratricopeptide (TPR) repeat protein
MSQLPVTPHEAPIIGSAHLPVRLPEQFFGRDSDLSSIHLALKAGTAVLLHGPAGIGKTALAAVLASGYAELPGGVLWLEVNSDSLLSLLVRAARAYGSDILHHDPDPATLSAAVRDLLRQNRPMIVLDGHLRVDAARDFIRQCASGIPLLLTHPQLAAGVWTPHAVRPLPLNDAQEMLCDLAGLKPETPGLAALNEALGGHALSIVVAGHQLKTGDIQPDAFLAQLPAMPPGETNRVMGVLMASYRLLPKDLQGILLLLGTAFAGGAGEDLLAEVGGAAADVMRGKMRQLVERGFASERMVYGQPYFTTHEQIQVFARTFLRGKKQLEAMQARHLKFLTAYIRQHVTTQPDRLAAEMPNVIAAGLFAAESGQSDALREIVASLEQGTFAPTRGFEAELGWLRQLAARPELAQAGVLGQVAEEPPAPAQIEAQPLGEPAGIRVVKPVAPPVETAPEEPAPMASAASEPTPPVPPEPITLAAAPPSDAEAVEQAKPEGAEAVYSESLKELRADGDVEDELATIEALAKLSLEGDNYEAVLSYIDRGTALAQETHNPKREGEMLILLGDMQASLGRLAGAETAYQEAINALRPVDAWLDIGLTLDKLGMLYLEQGRYQDAITIWEQTLPIFEREGRADLIQNVHTGLGDAHAEMQHTSQAQMHYSRALELARYAHDDWATFEQLDRLGLLMEESGRRDEAMQHYRRALHYAFLVDDPEHVGQTLLALAHLLIDDTVFLNRAVQILETAKQYLPDDTDVQRLLGRAKTRQNRLLQAGITLPLAEDSLQDYARAALEMA